jgi:hypothetical protein
VRYTSGARYLSKNTVFGKKSDKENFLISTSRITFLDKYFWDYKVTDYYVARNKKKHGRTVGSILTGNP